MDHAVNHRCFRLRQGYENYGLEAAEDIKRASQVLCLRRTVFATAQSYTPKLCRPMSLSKWVAPAFVFWERFIHVHFSTRIRCTSYLMINQNLKFVSPFSLCSSIMTFRFCNSVSISNIASGQNLLEACILPIYPISLNNASIMIMLRSLMLDVGREYGDYPCPALPSPLFQSFPRVFNKEWLTPQGFGNVSAFPKCKGDRSWRHELEFRKFVC